MNITSALLSVSNKTGILKVAQALHEYGIRLLATAGTAKALSSLPVEDVSDFTGFPEILGGRVKTLHPKIFGGILANPDISSHQNDLASLTIPTIELVIADLYPFQEAVKSVASPDTCLEKIDIGGVALLRAAAKNFSSCTVICDPEDYEALLDTLRANSGATDLLFRQRMALKAFAHVTQYDAHIYHWMNKQFGEKIPEVLAFTAKRQQLLNYGENPHQKAASYLIEQENIPSLLRGEQLQGKDLTYNNLNDMDSALRLVWEFSQPTAAVIKHANPCGLASASTLAEALHKAIDADPLSAFGGIIAVNSLVDETTAQVIRPLFLEALVAPAITDEAQKLLAQKKNLRVLIVKHPADISRTHLSLKSIAGGLLLQEDDGARLADPLLRSVTQSPLDPACIPDVRFAFTACKHVKSNAIVIVENQVTLGIGAGQMSRVDATQIALTKAAAKGVPLTRAVLASDGFFPFPDSIQLAAKAGISTIVQPGGSIRDAEVIKSADDHGITMVMTGLRTFRH